MIDNYDKHLAFQSWYKGEFPSRECRIQNLIGTYTTTHADNAFQEFMRGKHNDHTTQSP